MAPSLTSAVAMTSRSHVRGLLVLGVVFHAVYVLSIFDIYFTSPVVPHVESLAYASTDARAPPPAKRVVVFVADGCRADKFFESNASAEPAADKPRRVAFLRDVVERRGSWGVSHTRVPTESRPGHVALFAGMYEDVSAVTKGWQDNPVDFDSIFNQSQHAWLFGSPDIVPMFARRVPQATELHYSHEEEDFASTDASQLDVWVYERFRELLVTQAPQNETLDRELRAPQVVFFCHFLGIDTNGHAHRPQSSDYLNNIALVDELVEKVTRLVDDFYDYDGQTAFVFTADHGMSNKGAHGDGDPSNTRTPLVAWGAGVAGPEEAPAADAFRIDLPTQSRSQVAAQLTVQREQEAVALQQWKLAHLTRKDVMQADVAPLISSLLGLPYPRNSVGVLPFTYLAQGVYRTRAVLSNAQQLYLHALRKEQEKESRTLFFFRPYEPFRSELPRVMEQMKRNNSEQDAQRVIAICLETLEYFQRYDWAFLLSVIVAGYVGWIAFVAIAYLAPLTHKDRDFHALQTLFSSCTSAPFLLVTFATSVFLILESSPWTYLVYVSFPLVYWNAVWMHRGVLFAHCPSLSGTGWRFWAQTAWLMVSLELVVLGYNHRWIFGLVFLLLALWPTLDSSASSSAASRRRWSLACLLIAAFPFLPTEYGEHTALVVVGGLVVAAVSTHGRPSSWYHALPLLASLIAVQATMSYLNAKTKPPTMLTLLNWTLALLPAAALLVFSWRRASLVDVALALAPAYVLLSISYEVLFYAALCLVLFSWLDVESSSGATAQTSTVWLDLRRAFFFLLLVKIAFFGTGNVASMSSFEISSTYRFVTVFAPFLMGALLVIKILIPFLVVACAFRLLLPSSEQSTRYFLLVVALSDVLALQFLFLVRNEGSWKEIGNSISMFGIVNAQIVFVPLLFLLTGAFVSDAPRRTPKTELKSA